MSKRKKKTISRAVAREFASIGKGVLKGLAEIATLGLYKARRPRRRNNR